MFGDKTSVGKNVRREKMSGGKNIWRDKTSGGTKCPEGQNIRPQNDRWDKTFVRTKCPLGKRKRLSGKKGGRWSVIWI
jgi:hypothetical protein